MDRVHVVGVGAEGQSSLTPRAKGIVDRADLLVGGDRLLAMFPENGAERLAVASGLAGVLGQIEAALGKRRIVVLASGDPGFFGIAKVLVRWLGKERVVIIPNVSSVQLAFARIKDSWEDATFFSVHGRSLARLAEAVSRSAKAAILTDEVNTPAMVARSLLEAGVKGYRAYLCESLGGPDERVTETDLESLANREASPLNVLILLRTEESWKAGEPAGGPGQKWPWDSGAWPHGIPEEEFCRREPHRGLITKVEVRLAALAKLGLRESSVVWDVGSGSGSVAIEAAMITRLGRVYAVERRAENAELIRQNVAKFGLANVAVIHGVAPAALEGLPAPDSIFLGGSGGHLPAILDMIGWALQPAGRVVVNAATLETASAALAGLRERGFAAEATLMQVSRSKELAGLTHFEAMDPVFIIAGRRDHKV